MRPDGTKFAYESTKASFYNFVRRCFHDSLADKLSGIVEPRQPVSDAYQRLNDQTTSEGISSEVFVKQRPKGGTIAKSRTSDSDAFTDQFISGSEVGK